MPKYRITLEDGSTQIVTSDKAPEVGSTFDAPSFQGNPARAKRQEMQRMAGTRVTPAATEQERHQGTIEGGLEQTNPIARMSLGGALQAAHGGQEMGRGELARGGSNMIRGAMQAAAPAALPVGIAGAPMAMAMGVAGGAAGEGLGQLGAGVMGANPDQQALAGDIGGLLGGGLGATRGAPKANTIIDIAKATMNSPKARNAAIDMLPKGREGRRLASVVGDISSQYQKPTPGPIGNMPQAPHPMAAQAPHPLAPPQPMRPAPQQQVVGQVPPSSGAGPKPAAAPSKPTPGQPTNEMSMKQIMEYVVSMGDSPNSERFAPKEGRSPVRFDSGSGPVIDSSKRRIRGEGQPPAANPSMVKPTILKEIASDSPLVNNPKALEIAQALADLMTAEPRKTKVKSK